ncbi:MAG: glucose-1-phosphate adenylyltransferase subunit GlgD [Clostridia bacterium]|nr:glucose-1-phosphate adenylyltransferase subunit GlgD [Clostridia bacterium]
MTDAMGIILTRNQDANMNELTQVRDISALPFAGRYRLIDFVLSNMVNSGIINVGIATHVNYSSLMDHVGSGKPWDLNRKNYGLFMLPPQVRGASLGAAGDVDLLHNVLTYLHRSKQKYVVLTGANIVCNMTYTDIIKYHEEKGADVTVVYNEMELTDPQLKKCTTYDVNSTGKVVEIHHNLSEPVSRNAGMDIYIIERTKLQALIEDAYAKGSHSLINDILKTSMGSLNICAYKYDGFVGRIDSVVSYYDNNMKMLCPKVREELFAGKNPVYTKVKDQVPTKYLEGAQVKNSLVADGCIIDGTVENSIIFRGVHVAKGAVVKNCIVMQNSVISERCDLEGVVIDKECTIRMGKKLVGQPTYPFVLPKRTLV